MGGVWIESWTKTAETATPASGSSEQSDKQTWKYLLAILGTILSAAGIWAIARSGIDGEGSLVTLIGAGLGSLLFFTVSFAYLLGALLDFPKLEIRSNSIRLVNLLGFSTTVDLASFGPAYGAVQSSVPMLVFYSIEREDALHQAGAYQAPTPLTADRAIPLSTLVAKGKVSTEDIARAVNQAMRLEETAQVVPEDRLDQLVRGRSRLRRRRLWIIAGFAGAGAALKLYGSGDLPKETSTALLVFVLLVAAALIALIERGKESERRWVLITLGIANVLAIFVIGGMLIFLFRDWLF